MNSVTDVLIVNLFQSPPILVLAVRSDMHSSTFTLRRRPNVPLLNSVVKKFWRGKLAFRQPGSLVHKLPAVLERVKQPGVILVKGRVEEGLAISASLVVDLR